MLIMCIWVTIYSFFESSDFRDEVIILFGTVGFWTTVVITVILAIGESYCPSTCAPPDCSISPGPRFILKFISQAYFPMDKDIVREAWVAGDLKDRLGLKHRTGMSKGKRNTDPEDLSLFQPHVREASETSDRGDYEPVAPSSAPRSPLVIPKTVEPMVQYDHEMATTQYQERRASREPPPPSPGMMSYYSASDIPRTTPSPSGRPAPSPQTLLPPPISDSPRSAPSRNPYHNPPSAQLPTPPTQGLQLPYDPQNPNQSQASSVGLHRIESSTASRGSRASASGYVTASDGGWESDDGATVRLPEGDNRTSYYGAHAM